jgi:CelD/BcsL family acetyltransferase involved in cellulose biosynthesis
MSEIELRPFDGDPASWNAFVASSNNGTLFHRLDFLAYHGSRFTNEAHHLAWTKGGSLQAVMPLGIFRAGGRTIARSPFGASYGGIVVPRTLSLARARELVDSLLAYLRARGVAALSWVPSPGFYCEQHNDYVEFFLLKAGARVVGHELTSYAAVCDETARDFRHAAVKGVRKARESGVTVAESRDVDSFWDILAANRAKFDATPTHSRDEIEWLLTRLPDDVKLFLASVDGAPVAGSLVFRLNPRVIMDFYWAHRDEWQHVRPVSLLVHEILGWARASGVSWFDFGTQTIDLEPVEGSTRFKETFGALGVFRRKWEIDL